MRIYKDTFVGRGSDLALALDKSEAEAKKVYRATSSNYELLYSKEDRAWFAEKQAAAISQIKSNTVVI